MDESENSNIQKSSGKTRILAVSAIVIVIVAVSLAFVFFQQNRLQNSTGAIVAAQGSGPSMKTTTDNTSLQNIAMQSDVIDPSQFILREDYFKEVFKPRRESYKLLEKAAAFQLTPVDFHSTLSVCWNEHYRRWTRLSSPLRKCAFDLLREACYQVPLYRMSFSREYVDWDMIDRVLR